MDLLPSILGLLDVAVVFGERKDRYHQEVVDVDKLSLVREVEAVFNRSVVLLTIHHTEVVLYSEVLAVVDIAVLLLLNQPTKITIEGMDGGRIGVLDSPEVLVGVVEWIQRLVRLGIRMCQLQLCKLRSSYRKQILGVFQYLMWLGGTQMRLQDKVGEMLLFLKDQYLHGEFILKLQWWWRWRIRLKWLSVKWVVQQGLHAFPLVERECLQIQWRFGLLRLRTFNWWLTTVIYRSLHPLTLK